MSSQSIQPLIERLNSLNTQLDSEITKISNQEIDDSEKSITVFNQIKTEQEEIYNLVKSINENLYAKFVSAKTLNDHQNNLASKLDDYKKDIETDIDNLEDETNHKTRLAKINKYYGDKYQAHSQLIKLIILILIPIIILAFLKNKGFLPEDAFNALMLVVSIIGGILFFKKYKDVVSRDNMNYQEYDWGFRQDLAPNGDDTEDSS
jgi:hypothetical protein|uniref:DUF6161 domain-containing protein n=1 Tax=viral metagenome TaxID=1070528 RepID=A0A6C0IKF3_9ZZZZ